MATLLKIQEIDTIDGMVALAILNQTVEANKGRFARMIFETTHGVAEVMRQHCGYRITRREADDLAKKICDRWGV